MTRRTALLALALAACSHGTGPGPLELSTAALTVHRGDCAAVDTDRLLVAVAKAEGDYAACGATVSGVTVVMSATLPNVGELHGDTVVLRCGAEYALRHELGHWLCYRCRQGCDCSRVARLAGIAGHDLDLDCQQWGN